MTSEKPFLPYGRHCIDEADVAAVTKVLRGDWLTTGPAVPAFEKDFAETVGARHAVACSSGTAALHLAALAAGLSEGDAAIVPSVTFLATANCCRFTGAEVIFADVDARTGLMGPEQLELAIGRAEGQRVRAVFPVHLNGQCGDLQGIQAIAKAHELTVIEDACHALGSTWNAPDGGKSRIGDCAYSHMAMFSFHPVKTIAAGEAGAVTTNEEAVSRRLSRLRNHGMVREAAAFQSSDLAFDTDGSANPWYYEMTEPGYNYRLSDINAALAHSQLGKLSAFCERRRKLASQYDELLEPLAPMVRPVPRAPGCDPVLHLYVVHIDFAAAGTTRAKLMSRLREAGIGTQVHYLPVHMQPYYRERYGDQDLPGARAYYESCLTLPLFPAMAVEDVARVVDSLVASLGGGIV